MTTITSLRRHNYRPMFSVFSIMVLMAVLIMGMPGCSGGPTPINYWYELDRVRNNLGGSYILMNDLNATTLGYDIFASATANGGNGWDPIGSSDDPFTGTFDGNGHQISDMVINRTTRDRIGLFGSVEEGTVKNLGVANASVNGHDYVGGLVGWMSESALDNCCFIGNTSGESGPEHYSNYIGGLVGYSLWGSVSNCNTTGNVHGGGRYHGGLMGWNEEGFVENCCSNANVNGGEMVGGLIGYQWGYEVIRSYSTGNVTGCCAAGGLVGYISGWSRVCNSHYNYDEVLINDEHEITIGALFGDDFEEWVTNNKSLYPGNRLTLSPEGPPWHFEINNISDFKQLLAFGQGTGFGFGFILNNDLDLATEPDFYVPYLAEEFDGNGHTISNLSVNLMSAYGVGLFGYVDPDYGFVHDVAVENASITGVWAVGGLVGHNAGIVSNCHSTGNVRAGEYEAGGLVGSNMYGTVSKSYSCCDVDAMFYAGGLVGRNNDDGTVEDCYSTGNVTADWHAGGLVGSNEEGTLSNSYSIGAVTGGYDAGGLVGSNNGTVSHSLWDTETSGQNISAGGTGKNTTEMHDIDTFSGAAWNITAVANPGIRNPSYIWNIVDDETYPFLSWQP
jgi:hypothetical protein